VGTGGLTPRRSPVITGGLTPRRSPATACIMGPAAATGKRCRRACRARRRPAIIRREIPSLRSSPMTRHLSALALVLVSAPLAPADDKKLILRWHGQSFFELITTAGTRVVFDPHAIENYGRIQVKADLVLMSHMHADHTQIESVVNAKSAKLIYALKKGERDLEYNVVDEKFKDVHVQMLGTYHDTMSGLQRGKNGVIIVDADGLRFVHLGDLGHMLSKEQLRKLGTVDVLMIPVGGVYTLNGVDAQKVVEQIKPRHYIVPMHYGTLVYSDLLDLKYFLEDQTMGTEKKFVTNELDIDPKAEPPKEPVIAILHWESRVKKDKD
jgi:L-ascorbate metabolism protein UlaG (beta-lactamase superfamily)